jgi:hypothetical protein
MDSMVHSSMRVRVNGGDDLSEPLGCGCVAQTEVVVGEAERMTKGCNAARGEPLVEGTEGELGIKVNSRTHFHTPLDGIRMKIHHSGNHPSSPDIDPFGVRKRMGAFPDFKNPIPVKEDRPPLP